MLGRLVLLGLGYLYPGYMCFKQLERPLKPGATAEDLLRKRDALAKWCTYWIVIATFTFSEVLLDTLLSWLPLYLVLKMLFVVYLWHPKWQGAFTLYESVIRPQLQKHERQIDETTEWVKTHGAKAAMAAIQQAMTLVAQGSSGVWAAMMEVGKGGQTPVKQNRSYVRQTMGPVGSPPPANTPPPSSTFKASSPSAGGANVAAVVGNGSLSQSYTYGDATPRNVNAGAVNRRQWQR